MPHIAVLDVDRRQPGADAERDDRGRGHPQRDEQDLRPRRDVVDHEQDRGERERDGEVEQSRHDRRRGRQDAREVHARDEVRVLRQFGGGCRDGRRHVGPQAHRGIDEHRVRQAVRRQLREAPEDEREDHQSGERLQQRPGDAQQRLPVAHLERALREHDAEVAVPPRLAELESRQPAPRRPVLGPLDLVGAIPLSWSGVERGHAEFRSPRRRASTSERWRSIDLSRHGSRTGASLNTQMIETGRRGGTPINKRMRLGQTRARTFRRAPTSRTRPSWWPLVR